MTPCDYFSMPYKRFLIPDAEAGGFTAGVEEFSGCVTEGETIEEAMSNLERVVLSWLEVEIEAGRPIPGPSVLEIPTYSGRILFRLGPFLHRKAAEWAEKNNSSINQALVTAVSYFFGASEGATTTSYSQFVGHFHLHFDGTSPTRTASTADCEPMN